MKQTETIFLEKHNFGCFKFKTMKKIVQVCTLKNFKYWAIEWLTSKSQILSDWSLYQRN